MLISAQFYTFDPETKTVMKIRKRKNLVTLLCGNSLKAVFSVATVADVTSIIITSNLHVHMM